MGNFPPFLNSNEIKGNNEIFFSFISSDSRGDKIVLACRNTDIIEIYDSEKGLEKRLQGPLNIKLTILTQNIGSGYMLKPEPHYYTYRWISAGKDEFWLAYNGYKFEKGMQPAQNDQYAKTIYCFDWEGRALRKLDLKDPFISFDVDWDGKILFVLTWKTENPEIKNYSIDDYFK